MSDEPQLRLAEGQRLLDGGDLDAAVQILAPLTGHPDPELSTEAWLAIGNARYRMDDEAGALVAWQQAAQRGGSKSWLGWRSMAEQHVRDGELDEAVAAYREADRAAPVAERGAIANRIAWLLKETGHDFASRRQFNRARGAYGQYRAYVTLALVAINVVVWVIDQVVGGKGGGALTDAGYVGLQPVIAGEWWRLITYAFLHAPLGSSFGILHIGFNMYALYLVGPVIEELYGHLEYLAIYLLCAIGGGVLTILAAPDQVAVGASGAIFGLFGLGFVILRRHKLVLAGRARALLSQMGTILALNLVITFVIPGISWTGHVGGLVVGAVLGLLLPPSGVASMTGLWHRPDGTSMQRQLPVALRFATYAFVAAALAGGALLAVSGTFG
jgi:membrane associated rhomboid family serine protease